MAKLGSTYKGDIKEDKDVHKHPPIDNSLNIGSYFYMSKVDL